MAITTDGKWEGFIYRIYDKINDKNYIGQTITSIEERWKQHIAKSQRGSKNSFHKKIREVGIENFEVSSLDSVSTKDRSQMVEKLNYLEIKYIEQFDSFRNGYNSNRGGNGDKTHCKTKIICLETGVEFDSVIQASREMNICRSTIFSVLRGECITANGYTFRKIQNGEILHFERKKEPRGTGEKAVICLDTGKVFDSTCQAERELNISKAQIIRVCKGKQKTAVGLTFRYFKDNQVVPPEDKRFENKPQYICLETNEIFNTLSDISKTKGINLSSLSMLINGGYGIESVNGFTFRKIINGEIIEPDKSLPSSGRKLQRDKICRRSKIINITTGLVYKSMNEASRELNIPVAAVKNLITRKAFKDYGFQLRELDSSDNIIEPKQKLIDIKMTKKIKCINNNKVYESAKDAANDLNLFRPPIYAVCNGKQRHYKGYQFQYID